MSSILHTTVLGWVVWFAVCCGVSADEPLRVGFAETDITPPTGFPMSGYYYERLAEGTIDPLKAKAIVFRGETEQAAIVVCDLTGVSIDLATKVRNLAADKTGIAATNIVVSATHSHTAPDYSKDLYLFLADKSRDAKRAAYVEQLIERIAAAIVKAHESARPVTLHAGAARQETPVSFNRRFVMRDGSARTWMNFENPDVVRSAGPIDPEIGMLLAKSLGDDAPRGVLSNFALHLDTVGGLKWSADYPFFIEQTVRKVLGPDVVSVFGTGCCGDINHVDPNRRERNKSDFIGNSLGATVEAQLAKLRRMERTDLRVRSRVVQLPLQGVTPDELAGAVRVVEAANRAEKVDFFEHVTAYKQLILDELRHRPALAASPDDLSWGLSHTWAGIGDALPAEVQVICLGDELAIVCLPGEVFVELGLAIKQGSPFRTTLVIELSNCFETLYIPTRAAYAQGSYEVTNSALQPGSGEMLVEAALSLLREAATPAKVSAGSASFKDVAVEGKPSTLVRQWRDVTPSARHQIVCSGEAAGGYAAFPDVCRTKAGDLLCVFYSGYGHVSTPNDQWPGGGRVMAVRSTDQGKSWSEPFVIADTVHDDRDPHIAALSDGTLLCNWFVAPNPAKPLSDCGMAATN